MKVQKFFWIAAVVLTAKATSAQFYKYSNEFLSIGVGARALAMGGSVTATVNDVTAAFWNPAGLAAGPATLDIGLMHAEYFAGIAKYDYGAIALPMQQQLHQTRKLAFSLIRFGVDDIPNTLFLIEPDGSINYDNISSFSVADYAALVSYGQQTGIQGLSVGGTIKILHRIAGSFASSWGLGADVGLQYAKKGWKLAAVGRDITTTFNAWSYHFTNEEQIALASANNMVPENSLELTAPRLWTGASRQFGFGKNQLFTVAPALDLDVTFDGRRNTLIRTGVVSIDPRIGAEGAYKQTVFLRAGLNNFQRTSDIEGRTSLSVQPSAGVGLAIRSVVIDYALTNLGDLSGSLYSHVFSLRLSLSNSKKT
ncbi:MAG: hypothetical protein NZL95_05125 [Chitinophagales bacterium]|nr:hypothetical protein [Chitinophagales bacterium]MDW8427916.1 hypothetical protein [Chitinophagales bacterium]